MNDEGTRLHAMLVGIDDYSWPRALSGCVNDIEAIQRILLERLKTPAANILRFTSPRAEAPAVAGSVPSRPATLENLRDGLAWLDSSAVGRGDRVLIYYSGHGARCSVAGPTGVFQREALVPVDHEAEDPPRLLFDFELNACLRAIARRTPRVTVVLDCCHSAGAFRDAGGTGAARVLHLDGGPIPLGREQVDQLAEAGGRGVGTDPGAVGHCAVISSCQSDQQAKEGGFPGLLGPHGIFTGSLATRLAALPDARLERVTWDELWRPLVADTQAINPAQTPLSCSAWRRPVFGGDPQEGDVGIGVKELPDGSYQVEVGTLAGVSPGAVLAVYGPEPRYFPRIETAEEVEARHCTLRITGASRDTATAIAAERRGSLPDGARARVIQLSAPERLVVSVSGAPQPLLDELKRSDLFQIQTEGTDRAREAGAIRLTVADGRYTIGDDLNGVGDQPPLVTGLVGKPALIRALLDHCVRLHRPLWMAGRCTDLPDALAIRLLDASDRASFERAMAAGGAQDPPLPEVARHLKYTYTWRYRQACCLRVDNRSRERLRVALLNCAASGEVEYLGYETIEGGGRHVFWKDSTLGDPWVPEPERSMVCRLVAIGSTLDDRRLEELKVERSFDEVIEDFNRSDRGDYRGPLRGRSSAPPPPESWTATAISVLMEGDG